MNTNRVILTAILVLLSVAFCWAGGPDNQPSLSSFNGTLPLSKGGTGQTASAAALVALGGMKTDASNADAVTSRTNLGVVATSALFDLSGVTATTTARSNLGISNHNKITVDSDGNASFSGTIETAGTEHNFGGMHRTHQQSFLPIDNSGIATFTALGPLASLVVCGTLFVRNVSDGTSAIFALSGNTTTKLAGSSSITQTKSTGSSLNVYVASDYVEIENLRGAAKNVKLLFIGGK